MVATTTMMIRPVVEAVTTGATVAVALVEGEERVEIPTVEEDEIEAVDGMVLLQGIDHLMTMLDMMVDTMTEVGLEVAPLL